MNLLATLFLAGIQFSHGLRSIGIDESSPRRLVHNQRIAVASLGFDEASLFEAPTIAFHGMDDDPPAVFTKVESKLTTTDSGDQVIWKGTITNGIGFMSIREGSDGVLTGTFTTPNATYEVVKVANGSMEIRKVLWEDQADEGDEDDEQASNVVQTSRSFDEPITGAQVVAPEQAHSTKTSAGPATRAEPRDRRNLRTNRHLNSNALIDVMIVVTNQAMCEFAGKSTGCDYNSHKKSIEDRISVLIEQTNDAFQDVASSVEMRVVRIVHLPASVTLGPNTDSLNFLRTNGDINTWRNEVGADLVAGITGPGDFCGYGGVGPCTNCHTTVTAYNCFGGFSFTHELGHNLGALHDKGNSGTQHEYAHGYQNPGSFRSVMSYACSGGSCPRIPMFSSPNHRHNGQVLGTSSTDNAKRTNEVAPSIANYRETVVDLPPFQQPPQSPPTTTTSTSSGSGSCFPEAATVEVKGKGVIPMHELKIGDDVRAGGNQFSKVHGFYHVERDAEAVYLQIHTDNRDEPLEITANHLVFVDSIAKPAGHVNIGDHLGDSTVTAIHSVKRRGIYAPATFSGDIVVSGILTSTYSTHMPQAAINEHTGAHLVLTYHRLICRVNFAWCENETYTMGLSDWVYPVIRLAYTLGEFSGMVQRTATLVAVPFLAALFALEQLLLLLLSPSLLLGAIVAGYYSLYQYHKTAVHPKFSPTITEKRGENKKPCNGPRWVCESNPALRKEEF